MLKEQLMREIRMPNGEVYARIEVDERQLRIQLVRHDNIWIVMDAKVIPQLSDILKEAIFFKHI